MVHLLALAQYVQQSWLAIVLSIVAGIFIGFMWHGPLFGKQWMKYNNMTPPKPEDMKFSMMIPGLIAGVIMLFVQATILGRTFEVIAIANLGQALLIGGIVSFAFSVLAFVNNYVWCGKSYGHMALDAGYNFVTTLAVSAIVYLV